MSSNFYKIFTMLFAVFAFANCYESKIESSAENKDAVKREVFDYKMNPELKAVGRMIFNDEKSCSIVLVAEDIAVTAGHCLPNASVLSENEPVKIKKIAPEPLFKVVFKSAENHIIGINRIKKVIKAEDEPDFAIVQLKDKIPAEEIKPLKIKQMTLAEMLRTEKNLGCAGFNGDRDLGQNGQALTISRNVKIFRETSSDERIDTNCFSDFGGSGGLFFEQKFDPGTEKNEIYFLGVVWGLTDEKLDEHGKIIKDEIIKTYITPVNVFYKELIEEVNKN